MKFPLIFLLSLLFILACNKEKLTEQTDITQSEWKLKCISEGKSKIKMKKDDYKRERSYYLTFHSDSTYQLNTSVNGAGGGYLIKEKGSIDISSYGVWTLVCCENELDAKLLKYFPLVKSYQVTYNKLVFQGDNCELEFVKE